uniref:L-sorbosone dehydrogenase n=1 Tax=uncultured Armatimonadetes bacterium TaxID=157466 RepID=A0A6J4H520_9BACT|nr:L-sorbosone dehydrogenase [uncultured Armatimonadetes bacterium]
MIRLSKDELRRQRRARGRALLAAIACGGAVAAAFYAARSRAASPAPAPASAPASAPKPVQTGEAALGDWTTDAPGVRRRITTRELAKPFATPSVDNGPRMVPRPAGALPQAPAGFKVEEFAAGLNNPRVIRAAPNGDLFVAESRPGQIRMLRDADGDGKPEMNQVFATGLRQPFGIAFYPPGPAPTHVYVANTDSVVRFRYVNGDTSARATEEMIVDNISGGGQLRGGGHWTRDIAFSRDGRKMYVSVGSRSNVMERPELEAVEERRARIFEYTPDGKNERVFAWGIRNPVGIAVHPVTGDLWTSVNERDGLGDHLVPDYVTRVQDGGFYGWPWYYIGPNQDPRHEGKRADLRSKVLVPDVLLQSHSASLAMTFYDGRQFPRDYQYHAFAAEHGSWNRARRTGYKVVRIPIRGGRATGEYEDFLTGFVTPEGNVWGRPVGVTVGKNGALLVSDDGANMIWRVSYVGTNRTANTAR